MLKLLTSLCPKLHVLQHPKLMSDANLFLPSFVWCIGTREIEQTTLNSRLEFFHELGRHGAPYSLAEQADPKIDGQHHRLVPDAGTSNSESGPQSCGLVQVSSYNPIYCLLLVLRKVRYYMTSQEVHLNRYLCMIRHRNQRLISIYLCTWMRLLKSTLPVTSSRCMRSFVFSFSSSIKPFLYLLLTETTLLVPEMLQSVGRQLRDRQFPKNSPTSPP